jgi:hypothetical protein
VITFSMDISSGIKRHKKRKRLGRSILHILILIWVGIRRINIGKATATADESLL